MDISVVVPLYNEAESLPELQAWISRVMAENGFSYEVIYVNDGSTDESWAVIEGLARENDAVKGICFRRNYGKSPALNTGFARAQGDVVITMDADLQDPPSLLPEMFESLSEGYDMAATRRVTRKGEPVIRSFFARMFYKLMKRISRAEMVDGARDFRLMTRQVVDAVLSLEEYNRFTKGIFGWVGFRTKWLEFDNVERKKGETKWSFWKLFIYSLEGITSFSTAPLAFAAFMGVCFCLLSFFLIIFTIVRKAMFGDPTSGWPSLVCIISLISGVQLFCLGIVGQYLAKTYMEVKRRPIYLVKEEI